METLREGEYQQLVTATEHAGTTFDNAPNTTICDFIRKNTPTPVVLHLSSLDKPNSSNPSNRSQALRWFVGAPNIGTALAISPNNYGFCGAMIEYGCATAMRRVVMDWKPGSYQLPPCTYAKVSLLAYKTLGGAFRTGVTLRAAFSEGLTAAPARPEVSYGSSIIGTASGGIPVSFNVIVPAQARWVELWADGDPNAFAPGDTDAPQLVGRSIDETGAGLATVFRDYVDSVFLPAWGPVELGGVDNVPWTVTSLNTTTPHVHAWVRFFLEL